MLLGRRGRGRGEAGSRARQRSIAAASASPVTGLARWSSIPAAKHASRTLSSVSEVMATIAVRGPSPSAARIARVAS